jgi:hypothetical protein
MFVTWRKALAKCPVCGEKRVKQKEEFWTGKTPEDYLKVTFMCGGRYLIEDGEIVGTLSKCRSKK